MESKDRRNLLFLSVAIIINYYAGISIDSINILGNTATIDNPEALAYIVFIIWGYFFIRYYQHLHSKDDLSINEEFIKRLDKYSKPKIAKEMKMHGTDISNDFKDQSFSDLKREGFLDYRYTLYEQNGYGEIVEKNTVSLRFRIFVTPILKSTVTFILNSKCFTEYFIPLITAGGAFLYIVVTIFT
jgi:hypothetical protein